VGGRLFDELGPVLCNDEQLQASWLVLKGKNQHKQ